MLTQTATNAFKVGLATGSFNFNADTFKMALYTANATLDATTGVYTTANEVVGSGYTAGGQMLTVSTAPTVGVSGTIMYLSFANVTWSPASFTARGALIYDASNGNQTVCVLDFGSDKTAVNSFTVQFPTPSNTTAIIRIA
jgi:hypothetical protein